MKVEEVDFRHVEQLIAAHLDGWEAIVETESGHETEHAPNELERYYIESFVQELIGDPDFIRVLTAARLRTERFHRSSGGCPKCGKVELNDGNGAHWGPCDGKALFDETSLYDRLMLRVDALTQIDPAPESTEGAVLVELATLAEAYEKDTFGDLLTESP